VYGKRNLAFVRLDANDAGHEIANRVGVLGRIVKKPSLDRAMKAVASPAHSATSGETISTRSVAIN